MYSDERFAVSSKLELDLLLPSGEVVTCLAEVAWVTKLDARSSPAVYDIGLRFLQLPDGTATRIAEVLRWEDDRDPASADNEER